MRQIPYREKDHWLLCQGFWNLWRFCGRQVESALGIFIFSFTLNCCSRKYPDSFYLFQVKIQNSKEKKHFRTTWIQEKELKEPMYILQHMTQPSYNCPWVSVHTTGISYVERMHRFAVYILIMQTTALFHIVSYLFRFFETKSLISLILICLHIFTHKCLHEHKIHPTSKTIAWKQPTKWIKR